MEIDAVERRRRVSQSPRRSGQGLKLGEKLPALFAVTVVRGVTSVPSAFRRQMFKVILTFGASLPSSFREELKTTLVPSGL